MQCVGWADSLWRALGLCFVQSNEKKRFPHSLSLHCDIYCWTFYMNQGPWGWRSCFRVGWGGWLVINSYLLHLLHLKVSFWRGYFSLPFPLEWFQPNTNTPLMKKVLFWFKNKLWFKKSIYETFDLIPVIEYKITCSSHKLPVLMYF